MPVKLGATILIAEDDVAYGEAISDLLRREGHAVDIVCDGEEAIAMIRRLGDRLDLVLCDLLLPKRTGFEVVQAMAEMDLDVPVLAMTGVYDSVREVHALRGLGVRGYVHKSAPFEHVLFRVNNVLFPHREEARGRHRVAVSVPVRFVHADRTCYGTTYNLSESGLYVRTSESLTEGAVLDLALALPTAREMVRLRADVVHTASVSEVRGTAYPAGFGARFHAVSPLAEAAVRHFVAVVHREETTGEGLGSPEFPIVEKEQVEEEEPVSA